MERGTVIGGLMLGVSLMLALVFNIHAARDSMPTDAVIAQPAAPELPSHAEKLEERVPDAAAASKDSPRS